MKHRTFPAVILAFVAISLGLSSAQDVERKIWPPLNPTQWFWHEAKKDLAPTEIEAIFGETAAKRTTFLDPEFANSVLTSRRITLTTGKPRDNRKKPSKVDGMKFDVEWQSTEDPKLKGNSSCFIALDSIKEIRLLYVSNVQSDNWRVKMISDLEDLFTFKEETAARRFIDGVASALMQKALKLGSPKLGLTAENLTPEQAEALGKTMIESVLVTDVAIDGPADQAGIKRLDIIAEVNGAKVRNASHFTSLVDAIASGSPVSMAVLERTEVPDTDPKQYAWKPKTAELVAK